MICTTLDKKRLPMTECGLIDYKGDTENRPFLVTYYESGNDDEILAERLPDNSEAPEFDTSGAKKLRPLDRFRRSIESFLNVHGTFKTHRKRSRNSMCARHELYIRFRDLGWQDWVISPEGYAAGYCEGECVFPLSDSMNASNHAIIQSLVAMIVPSEIPKPCCAPIEVDPMRVLLSDENSNFLVMKRYPSMIVKDCGCQ